LENRKGRGWGPVMFGGFARDLSSMAKYCLQSCQRKMMIVAARVRTTLVAKKIITRAESEDRFDRLQSAT
jgi:hypothetical protein